MKLVAAAACAAPRTPIIGGAALRASPIADGASAEVAAARRAAEAHPLLERAQPRSAITLRGADVATAAWPAASTPTSSARVAALHRRAKSQGRRPTAARSRWRSSARRGATTTAAAAKSIVARDAGAHARERHAHRARDGARSSTARLPRRATSTRSTWSTTSSSRRSADRPRRAAPAASRRRAGTRRRRRPPATRCDFVYEPSQGGAAGRPRAAVRRDRRSTARCSRPWRPSTAPA